MVLNAPPTPNADASVTLDQLDVELIDIPDLPPRKGVRPTLRDAFMIGLGVFLALVGFGFCWVVMLVYGLFFGG